MRGKQRRNDVIMFQAKLMDNILDLHNDLKNKTYQHGEYIQFNISDPKPRVIHKATVRDRLLHHLIYQELYPYFDKKFISDSYSCRLNKGTHRAMDRFREFAYKVSKNNTRTCWILKCDIKKFFASIDHQVLKAILSRFNLDNGTLWLLERVIASHTPGLPLGNLTSQLLVNVYMNEFDQFVKHKLKVKYYIRYADDFVILGEDKNLLVLLWRYIAIFLRETLKLELHNDKVFVKTLASGVDFLGWVHFPDHRVLRTTTKRRMLKNLSKSTKKGTIQSYLGMLSHGNLEKLKTYFWQRGQKTVPRD